MEVSRRFENHIRSLPGVVDATTDGCRRYFRLKQPGGGCIRSGGEELAVALARLMCCPEGGLPPNLLTPDEGREEIRATQQQLLPGEGQTFRVTALAKETLSSL